MQAAGPAMLPSWSLWTIVAFAICFLWYTWWRFPAKAAHKKGLEDTKHTADIEDAYRKSIAQAIGSIAIVIALFLTWTQYVATEAGQKAQMNWQDRQLDLSTRQILESRSTQDRVQKVEQYQKALELLNTKEVAAHVAAIYGLEQLARDSSEWREAVTLGLSAAAVSFSFAKIQHRPTMALSDILNSRISPDAESALQAIGRSKNVLDISFPLAQGKFRGASLVELFFNRANLQGSDLSGSDLYGSHFYQANLFASNLNGVSAVGADFSHARLVGITACPDMSLAVPSKMDGGAVPAEFTSATFYSSNIKGAWFIGALMAGTRLVNSMATSAHFERANLYGAVITSTNLERAQFQRSDVRNATFQFLSNGIDSKDASAEAMLAGSSFRGANLAETKFINVSVSKVDLRDTNLQDTRFPETAMAKSFKKNWRGARFCKTVFADGVRNDGCRLPVQFDVSSPDVQRSDFAKSCNLETVREGLHKSTPTVVARHAT